MHSQEKFARENFASLTNIGKQIKTFIDEKKKNKVKLDKQRKDGKLSDEDYDDKVYSDRNEISEELKKLFTVLTIKLSTTLGHALNSNSTRTLKDIINFMDTYGISDKPLISGLSTIVNTRYLSNDSILDLCAVVAAQVDDIDFIKTLEAFAEKNKTRENQFAKVSYSYSAYGEMNSYNLTSIDDKKRIAFEALVSGSDKVYAYYGGSSLVTQDYVLKYIIKSEYWNQRLTKNEITNVLRLEPELFEVILKHMPENIPQEIFDIFIF